MLSTVMVYLTFLAPAHLDSGERVHFWSGSTYDEVPANSDEVGRQAWEKFSIWSSAEE